MPPRAATDRESDLQHRIDELKEQLKAAEASTAARAALRDYVAKHPALTAADVAIIAGEMKAPGRFAKPGSKGAAPFALALKIGRELRASRTAKGWSVVQAGEKVGVHFSSISGWERGTGVPSKDHRPKLKSVLGVDVDALKAKAANGAAAK